MSVAVSVSESESESESESVAVAKSVAESVSVAEAAGDFAPWAGGAQPHSRASAPQLRMGVLDWRWSERAAAAARAG